MTSIDQRRLMQLHDGELSDEEARELDQLLELDEQARETLQGLEQIGEFVRAAELPRLTVADSIAADVFSRIEAERRVVVPLAERRNKARWWWSAVPAAAAAAALLFVAQRNVEPPSRVAEPSARASAGPIDAPTLAPTAPPLEDTGAVELSSAASIESVDFGPHTGTIFMVPAGQAETPVVWLVDEPEQARGYRNKPL